MATNPPPTIYDLAWQCHDLVQEYRPDYRCTVHEMAGIWHPEAEDGAWDKWLEGLTVRVWQPRPGQPDLLVLECGPADYPDHLLQWLSRDLAQLADNPEDDEEAFLGVSPAGSARLLELAFHPRTPSATRRALLAELLPLLTRARAAELLADLTAAVAEGGPPAPARRSWTRTGQNTQNHCPHPFPAHTGQ